MQGTQQRSVRQLFVRKAQQETVATRIYVDANTEAIWNELIFFEEVRQPAPLLLRIFLPQPLRTVGDKTNVGNLVRCVYARGEMLKRITRVEPPCFLCFDVVEQHLGIEDCITTLGGSYEIRHCGDTADVTLTTNYASYLHPRRLWRPLEALLARQLHRHIIRGICVALLKGDVAAKLIPEAPAPESATTGGVACTASQSFSPR